MNGLDDLIRFRAAGWRQRAACLAKPTSLFFPESPSNQAADARATNTTDMYDAALAKCAVCPVRTECLEAHIDEAHGVFGGTVPRERRRMRADRAAARRQPAA